jgi:DNA-binding transcriptional ArsR family regulator
MWLYFVQNRFDYFLVILYNLSMNWSDKRLNVLNLTKNERLVLNTISEPRSVQEISSMSGLSRTGINHILKNLKKEYLVTQSERGKRRFYTAIESEELVRRLKKVIGDVSGENIKPKGAHVRTSKEDEFIIHVGDEIVPAYEKIALENKNERIKAIQHHRSWKGLVNKLQQDQLVKFNKAIIDNHLIVDGILNEGAYKEYGEEIKNDPTLHESLVKSLEGRMADYTVFADKFFDYDTEIWLFKNSTLIINWVEEIAIEIKNINITGFLKDMFEFVKSGNKKIDHNKLIKEILEKNRPV